MRLRGDAVWWTWRWTVDIEAVVVGGVIGKEKTVALEEGQRRACEKANQGFFKTSKYGPQKSRASPKRPPPQYP